MLTLRQIEIIEKLIERVGDLNQQLVTFGSVVIYAEEYQAIRAMNEDRIAMQETLAAHIAHDGDRERGIQDEIRAGLQREQALRELVGVLCSFAEFYRAHEGSVFLGRDIGVLLRRVDELLGKAV